MLIQTTLGGEMNNSEYYNIANIHGFIFVNVQWCEARPECNRLQLKQLLVTPMQRLTRYSLLLNAVAKKTAVLEQKQNLERMV